MEENGVETIRKALDRIINRKEVYAEETRKILIDMIDKNREIREKVNEGLYLEILDRECDLLRSCLEALGTGGELDIERIIKKRRVRLGVVIGDIPKFVGKENIEIGPFKKGDIIAIDDDDLGLLKGSNYLDIIEDEI